MDVPIRTIYDIIERVDNNFKLDGMVGQDRKALKMTDKKRKQLI